MTPNNPKEFIGIWLPKVCPTSPTLSPRTPTLLNSADDLRRLHCSVSKVISKQSSEKTKWSNKPALHHIVVDLLDKLNLVVAPADHAGRFVMISQENWKALHVRILSSSRFYRARELEITDYQWRKAGFESPCWKLAAFDENVLLFSLTRALNPAAAIPVALGDTSKIHKAQDLQKERALLKISKAWPYIAVSRWLKVPARPDCRFLKVSFKLFQAHP